ncbi:hypothetical protein GWI33_016839 [Rhynchophorus ferrugineus]|uniref:Uncharacterized protein n=1 Tax=Rhynchophorus ferrugineus TaxID=354439 RepID=A0A834IAA9_RHYFE|nr:hypothetical protein GWI33_016839 [Rhynchophorus ferrugineus]
MHANASRCVDLGVAIDVVFGGYSTCTRLRDPRPHRDLPPDLLPTELTPSYLPRCVQKNCVASYGVCRRTPMAPPYGILNVSTLLMRPSPHSLARPDSIPQDEHSLPCYPRVISSILSAPSLRRHPLQEQDMYSRISPAPTLNRRRPVSQQPSCERLKTIASRTLDNLVLRRVIVL